MLPNIKNQKSPLFMGVLNITPDSFSDGGKYFDFENAIRRAKQIESDGADILDMGGESTGPGSKRISLEEEERRIIPLLKKIRKEIKIPISIDTYKSEVARQALEEGVNIINDVSALRADRHMAKIISKYNCPAILMFSKESAPHATIKAKKYKDVIKTISVFFEKQISYAEKNGIRKSKIIIDPGMGQFISSIPRYSFEILARLQELQKFSLPILIGASRKSFLGGKLEDRDEKMHIAHAIAYVNGASILRVHNVKAAREFFKNF